MSGLAKIKYCSHLTMVRYSGGSPSNSI